MSTDGRPIATITPGVAIYVTALLEFVAEYILQNVGRVIERDNSDEAGLSDLKKAMEEDEGTAYWWAKLMTKKDIGSKEKEDQLKGGKGRVVGKPWKVPDASEYDEAAGRKKFQRQSLSFNQNNVSTPRPDTANTFSAFNESRATPSGFSSSGHESRDSSTFASNRVASSMSASHSNQTDMTSASSNASTDTHNLTRRPSSDKGWFGKRRGSFRSSQDLGTGIPVAQTRVATPSDANKGEDLDGSDDFDTLIVSGGTMKVSLTPNRLRAIEVTKDKGDSDEDAKRNTRRRPGTLSPLSFRDGDVAPSAMTPRSGQPSPAATANSRMSMQQENGPGGGDDGESANHPPRSGSRQGSISGTRSTKSMVKGAAPPSAYRAVDPNRTPTEKAIRDEDEVEVDDISPQRIGRKDVSELMGAANVTDVKLQPRTEMRRGNSIRDMVDMFNSTPPNTSTNGPFPSNSSGRESRMSLQSNENFGSNSNGRKSALSSAGGKMRNLFGRKTPSISSSAGGGQTRLDSVDSTIKSQFTSDRRGDDEYSEASYNPSKSGSVNNNNVGLAIAGTAGGAVALDALTTGLLEGHDHSRRKNGGMPGTLEPEYDEAPTRPSKEASVDESFESGDSKYGVPMGTTIPAHPLASASNVAASRDGTSPSNGVDNQVNNRSNSVGGNSGLVGLYQEPRGNVSASELSSSNHHSNRNDPPSRKIPWSYSRQSSNNRRLSGTAGPMGPTRVGSGGSSSLGHGSGGDQAPPSAWSHGQNRESNGSALDLVNGGGVKTPTPMAPSTFSSNSPRSPLISNRPSDTARILSQLNLKMKETSSVEECRFLVTQALAAAAAAVHSDLEPASTGMMRTTSALSNRARHQKADSGSNFGEIPDEEVASSVDTKKDQDQNQLTQGTTTAVNTENGTRSMNGGYKTPPLMPKNIDRAREHFKGPLKHRNLLLPMAVGYNSNEDFDTPSYKRQGSFAAWLLDGEEFDQESLSSSSEKSQTMTPLPPHTVEHLAAPTQKIESFPSSQGHSPDDQETFESADDRMYDSPRPNSYSKVSGGPVPDRSSKRRMSNVESIHSLYRDASDGSENEDMVQEGVA